MQQPFALIAIAAAVFVFYDRRTVGGYELRMRGLNPRFAAYGGVMLKSQAMRIMFARHLDASGG